MKKLLLSAITLGAALSQIQAAPLTPLNATGWNQDIVIGAGELLPGGHTETVDGNNSGTTFYGVGFNTGAPTTGLPIGPTASQTTPTDLSFTLQPFDAVNALIDSGTLTLTTPAPLLRLSLIGATGNGSTPNFPDVTVTVTHADATTEIFSGNNGINLDWITNTPPVYDANGRVDVNTGVFGFVNIDPSPRLYASTFTLANTTSNVVSVSFNNAATDASNVVVMAISGEAVPEPTTLALGVVSGLGTLGLVRRRRA